MADSQNDDKSTHPRVELSTPKQAEAPADSFLLNAREVKTWTEQLPVANVGETARQVYKTLASFNRMQVPTLVRAEIIELFREPVRYINTNITKHYINVGFPLSPKARKAALLATELCNEIAISYKILFLEQVLGDERNFNQKLVIVAAQRALQYMKQRMFHNLLVYRNYQKGLWQEANYLYAWASQNHVHQIGVKENSKFMWKRKSVQSIEDVYKDMLLISTTSPHRLTQSHLRRVHDKLSEWDKLAEIGPIEELDHQSGAGVFYLNLWSDEPPQKTISPPQLNDSRFRAIDLNGILTEVRREYEAAEWESPAYLDHDHQHLSRSLLRLLIRGWNKSLERKFARNPLQHELYAVVGLSNLLRLLEKNIEEAAAEEQASNKQEKKAAVNAPSHLTWNDSVFSTLAIASPINSLGGDSLFNDSNNLASTLLGTEGDTDNQNLFEKLARDPSSAFSVLTYNESVEGYCLGWKDSYPMKVRVGDILGIRSPNNPDEYSVAVTRWLKDSEKEDLYIGIQILASSCSPVTITPGPKASSNRQNQYRCLLISGGGLDSERRGILTNTRAFDLNTTMTMVTEFGEHQIRLTQWVESNNNFIHYYFSYVEEQGTETVGAEPEDNFQDLWNEL